MIAYLPPAVASGILLSTGPIWGLCAEVSVSLQVFGRLLERLQLFGTCEPNVKAFALDRQLPTGQDDAMLYRDILSSSSGILFSELDAKFMAAAA